jgi:hypothetical protein
MSESNFQSRQSIGTLSGVPLVLILCLLTFISSCKGPERNHVSKNDESSDAASVQTAPLSSSTLNQISNTWGLVRLNDGTLRQGILIQTGQGSAGNTEYIVLADAPAENKRVEFAIGSSNTKIFSAIRKGELANGLVLFGFSTQDRLESFSRHTSKPGAEVHSIRLSTGEPLDTSELASLRSQLEQTQRSTADILRSESQGMRPSPRLTNRPVRTESARLAVQAANLNASLKFATRSLAVAETAAATSSSKLDGSASTLNDTVLVGEDYKVFAIRHRDEWVNIDEVLDTVPTRPNSAKLTVSGSNSSLNLSISLTWDLPPASTSFSIVAATTHELETQGVGSLAERLAQIPKQRFSEIGSGCEISTTVSWAGNPTTLWIKVMDDAKPDELILDEAISLEYDGTLVASWAKPPSELIELPQAGTNTPEDLVKETVVIDAGGTVLDLIPSADSSVLLVRTDKPPFWSSLAVKSGTLGKVPWSATSDTLVAVQAGKTYLANRKTQEVEIWDDTTGKRESVRLMNLPGELLAIAAPRLAPGSPVLVITSQTAAFVDSSTFKAMNWLMDPLVLFPQAQSKNRSSVKMDPVTMWPRASADGALYSISGVSVEADKNQMRSLSMQMIDGMVTNSIGPGMFTYIPTSGRNQGQQIPDQAGGDLSLTVARNNSWFPGPTGPIEFQIEGGNRSIGELASAPFVPSLRAAASGTALPMDRRLYLDSSLGALLIPQDDRIHLLRLKLPEIFTRAPDFVYSGETVKIPLPRGTNHRGTPSIGGEVAIDGDFLIWTVPDKPGRSNAVLQMDWTGELGSPMERKVEFLMNQSPTRPVIVSPDGKRTIKLAQRTMININYGDYAGIAGAGNVILRSYNNKKSAWSLIDGSKISEIECDSFQFIGDADRIYSLDHKGLLSCFDIRTGKLLKSKEFGGKSLGSQQGVSYIATGSASRSPLVAIAFDGSKEYYAQIDRDSLELGIFDFGAGDPPKPTYRLHSNATGAACWSFSNGIFRQGNRATVKTANGAIEGTPDASGRFLVDDSSLMDLAPNPSKKFLARELPGAVENSKLNLDVSGRFLLITDYDIQKDSSVISVRKLEDGFKEIFKIRYPGNAISGGFVMISNTRTLITSGPYGGGHTVYDLDCEAIEKEIATGNP